MKLKIVGLPEWSQRRGREHQGMVAADEAASAIFIQCDGTPWLERVEFFCTQPPVGGCVI